ncbi:MAG TPA: hypothetical protein VI796_05485, partial [Candidatus Thermoplasmatota archaeon]|nr:hypothetical protein [Candidatus Thermoplasmatota archaeon]
MARILVAGSNTSLAARQAVAGLVERLRADGHDADTVPTGRPLDVLEDADALVALLDGPVPDAEATALLGYAHALGKPTLGLRGSLLPPALGPFLTLERELRGEADLDAVLPAFYDRVRPFAGRLVRDQVPDLV